MNGKYAEVLRRYAAMFGVSSGFVASAGGGDVELAVKAIAGAMSPALSLGNTRLSSNVSCDRFTLFNARLRDTVLERADVCDGASIEFVLRREVSSELGPYDCMASLDVVMGGSTRGRVFAVSSGDGVFDVGVSAENMIRLAGRILEFVATCGADYEYVAQLCELIRAATVKAVNIVMSGSDVDIVRKVGTSSVEPLDELDADVLNACTDDEVALYTRVSAMLYDIARRAASVVCGTVLRFPDVADGNVEIAYSGEASSVMCGIDQLCVHSCADVESGRRISIRVSLFSRRGDYQYDMLRLFVDSEGKVSHMGERDVLSSCAKIAHGVMAIVGASGLCDVEDVIGAIDVAVLAAARRFAECPDISIALFGEAKDGDQ